MGFEFEPIGVIHSPFKEKFGVPRQSGIVKEVQAVLELYPPYDNPDAFAGLDRYSHLWIQFVFDQNMEAGWQPKVRPPRLGGNQKVGVFASRSPYRPNPIGLSVVRLDEVRERYGSVELLISGVDMVEGTPVLDIKPYVAYSDSIAHAESGFAPSSPEASLRVNFSQQALDEIANHQSREDLRSLITHLLEIDPRPAYKRDLDDDREYGFRLYDFDLRWRIVGDQVEVLSLEPVRDDQDTKLD